MKKIITLVLAVIMLTQTALASVYADEVAAEPNEAVIDAQEEAIMELAEIIGGE